MAFSLALPPQGDAAVGDLSFVGCHEDDVVASGCIPVGSMDETKGVAVSQDGLSVYSTSFGNNAINHFSRAGDGALGFAGCVSNAGSAGCANPTPDPFLGATGVAVTADGSNVYVASDAANSLSWLDRAAGGGLTFDDCYEESSDVPVWGCEVPAFSPVMEGAIGVAVRPNGSHVLLAAEDTDTLVFFPRSPGGLLGLPGCFRDGLACGGSAAVPSLDGAMGVAISPDGADAYVAARLNDAVSHFNFTGGLPPLSFGECIGNAGVDGCVNPSIDSLNGAWGITVSPDGKSVYVASDNAESVTHLARASDGSLTHQGCVANDGGAGCVDPPIDSLSQARAVAVSPDGLSVYVASHNDSAITEFARAADGSLTFSGCVAEAGANGCVDPPIDSLLGADAVAVSADGASVYVGAQFDASLTHFARELPPPPSGPAAAAPSVTPAAKAPAKCKKKKKKRGKQRAAVTKKKKKKCKKKRKKRK